MVHHKANNQTPNPAPERFSLAACLARTALGQDHGTLNSHPAPLAVPPITGCPDTEDARQNNGWSLWRIQPHLGCPASHSSSSWPIPGMLALPGFLAPLTPQPTTSCSWPPWPPWPRPPGPPCRAWFPDPCLWPRSSPALSARCGN